jgi:hypothetical protein
MWNLQLEKNQAVVVCFYDENKEFLPQENSVMGVTRNRIQQQSTTTPSSPSSNNIINTVTHRKRR